uniref:Transmembrane protein n=1 Tax=Syphacia muris TaxID=451379 RepID=A0A0N5AX37_9BILA
MKVANDNAVKIYQINALTKPFFESIEKTDECEKLLLKNVEITVRSTNNSKTQLGLMLFLTVQQIAMPLLVRFAKQQNTDYQPTVLVFITEVLKLIMCLAIITTQNGSFKKLGVEVYKHIVCNVSDTLKSCVPAVVYALQNNLYYIALHNINAAQYTV